MNEDLLTLRLDQLGEELGSTKSIGDQIVDRLKSDGRVIQRRPSSFPRPRHWKTLLTLAAALLVCAGIWWIMRPVPLYARVMAALVNATTVHATGWATDIPRKWPLEKRGASSVQPSADGRHPVEFWYWNDSKGVPCSYERGGPVVLIRRGGDLKEYQPDVDLTYVYQGGYHKDRIGQFESLFAYFAALERPRLTKTDLGTRDEGGRKLRGLRLTEGERAEEIWFDSQSDLPVRLSRLNERTGQKVLDLEFRINEELPQAIAEYTPPKTKTIRYGSGSKLREEWLQHVAEIGERLQAEPIKGRIALLPRDSGRTFSLQYSLKTADGKYWVRPIDIDQYMPMTLALFVRDYAATVEDGRRHGTWRLARKFHDVEFPRADLVHEADVPWQEWVQFMLREIGFEYHEQTEDRPYWIARHDGRAQKPWQQVKPPVPYVVQGGVEKKGIVRPGVGFKLRPATLVELFDDFNTKIDGEMAANKPWIKNETDLPTPPPYNESVHGTQREYYEKTLPQFYAATDSPWFVGQESVEMARDWYEKEFGITFEEEMRPTTVHIIQPKQDDKK